MSLRPQLRFVYGQVAWMLTVLVLLALFGSVALDLFFSLSFVGLFVLMEFSDPFHESPELRTRLRIIAIVGLLVFGYILLDRLFAVLVEELP